MSAYKKDLNKYSYTVNLTRNGSKKAWPPQKPLRMTDMCISLICMSVIQQTVNIWAGRGAGDLILQYIASVVQWKERSP